MSSEFLLLAQRVADLERRMGGTSRPGTVEEVYPDEGKVRLRLGEGAEEGPYLSAKIPYAQTAGDVKIHNPPSAGQQMTAMAPDGDLRNAVAVPMTFSDAIASPSGAGDNHVITFGSVTITMTPGSLTLAVGGSSIVLDGNVTIVGGTINLN